MRGERMLISNRWYVVSVLLLFLISFVSASYTGKVMVADLGAEIDPGIIVNDTSFRSGGSSTPFLYMNDMELMNISGMTLEVPLEGKISYINYTDITVDAVDNYVPLSENVEISHNYIMINSTAMPSLNGSALIYFYGLTFMEPKVFKDGVYCNVTCNVVSYIGGDLIVLVDSFSAYSVVEGYVAFEPEGNDGDFSSGGGESPVVELPYDEDVDYTELGYDFNVSEYFIDVNLMAGQYYSKEIVFVNNGTKDLRIAFDFEEIGAFAYPNERVFDLSVGEKKIVEVDFYFPRGTHPGVYFGKINFNSMYVKRSASLVLNLNQNSLFDVKISMLKDVITPYENPRAKIELTNLGDMSVDVNLTYAILDIDERVIRTKRVAVLVNNTLTLEKKLNFPSRMDGGNYLFYVRIDYGISYAFSSDSFYVMDKSFKSFLRYIGDEGIVAVMMVLMMIGTMVGAILYYRRRKKNELNRKRREKKRRF
jgi:hypothetical protein